LTARALQKQAQQKRAKTAFHPHFQRSWTSMHHSRPSHLGRSEGGTSRDEQETTVMYDTVVATLDWEHPIDEGVMQGGRVVRDLHGLGMVRMWYNQSGDWPRVTYFRPERGLDGARLRVEFSIPRLAKCGLYHNPTEADKEAALDVATVFLRERLSADLPDIRMWRAARVDYAYNWTVGADMLAYLTMLQKLTLGSLVRTAFADAGVVWKGKRKGTRWVKFYDKSKELGDGSAAAVLRFEVSNFRKSLPYMCQRWFCCEQTVGELVRPGRALYCMAVIWAKLGLDRATAYDVDDDLLLVRMHKTFGRAAAGAYHALQCIRLYGAAAHRVHGVMSSNTYYRWKRELTKHNYTALMDAQYEGLLPLELPVLEVFNTLNVKLPLTAQNLDAGDVLSPNDAQKNLWEKLGLAGAAPSKYLMARLGAYEAR